jgi:hypothetical protein
MKLSRFFELAVAAGSRADPRGAHRLFTYADSAILHGRPSQEVRSILAGIDIDVPELLLADRLRSSGRRIDCVLSHHPSGKAFAGLFKVMELQVGLLVKAGLDRRSAEEFLRERQREVERKMLPANHARAVDAARLLDIPFVCCHTPADNCASRYIGRLLAAARPEKVSDVLAALSRVEEYRHAREDGTGPRLVLGGSGRPAGRIFVEMTGGTEGPKDAYEPMRRSGIGTLVSMHIGEDHLVKIKGCGLNAVIAGHISSDTLGMNLMLDAVEREEALEIICCSGFRRYHH